MRRGWRYGLRVGDQVVVILPADLRVGGLVLLSFVLTIAGTWLHLRGDPALRAAKVWVVGERDAIQRPEAGAPLDPWGRPWGRGEVLDGGERVRAPYSFGPDGRDDQGLGDDVVVRGSTIQAVSDAERLRADLLGFAAYVLLAWIIGREAPRSGRVGDLVIAATFGAGIAALGVGRDGWLPGLGPEPASWLDSPNRSLVGAAAVIFAAVVFAGRVTTRRDVEEQASAKDVKPSGRLMAGRAAVQAAGRALGPR